MQQAATLDPKMAESNGNGCNGTAETYLQNAQADHRLIRPQYLLVNLSELLPAECKHQPSSKLAGGIARHPGHDAL